MASIIRLALHNKKVEAHTKQKPRGTFRWRNHGIRLRPQTFRPFNWFFCLSFAEYPVAAYRKVVAFLELQSDNALFRLRRVSSMS